MTFVAGRVRAQWPQASACLPSQILVGGRSAASPPSWFAALIGGWAVRAQAETGNLLAGKRPARSEGVTHAGPSHRRDSQP